MDSGSRIRMNYVSCSSPGRRNRKTITVEGEGVAAGAQRYASDVLSVTCFPQCNQVSSPPDNTCTAIHLERDSDCVERDDYEYDVWPKSRQSGTFV